MAIVGPTASGKTELAIRVAERLNGELVSMDSRQVFRQCDIGTNKPTRAELRGLALHAIDVVDPGLNRSETLIIGETTRLLVLREQREPRAGVAS